MLFLLSIWTMDDYLSRKTTMPELEHARKIKMDALQWQPYPALGGHNPEGLRKMMPCLGVWKESLFA